MMHKITPSNKLFSHGWKIIFLGCLALSLSACGGSSNKSDNPNNPKGVTDPNEPNAKAMGYLYTTTNGNGENAVLTLVRYENGDVANEGITYTGGQGGANIAAGGDAHGDFDGQGAIQIIGNRMLVVNTGANSEFKGNGSISVFSVDRSNGDLSAVGVPVNSGGVRPVSIAYTAKKDASGKAITDQYWVVVGNQWNNPNVQKGEGNKDDADIERYPDNDGIAYFFKGDTRQNLETEDATDPSRNITRFSFDASTGVLSDPKPLATYVRENGGPTTVTFSDDGSKLAVSTWGVAHFMTATPSTVEQKPSRVYVYDFDKNGEVGPERHFEKVGIAGTIGINWAPKSNTVIHASNFNLTSELNVDHGLTQLIDSGTTVTLDAYFTTGPKDNPDEACWTVLNPDGTRLYVSSFGANTITPFDIKADGKIDKALPFETRPADTAPPGDTKDMYITPDNKYMYNLGAFQSYSMNTFEITDTGVKYKDQYEFKATKLANNVAGSFNFFGLTGFDIATK